MKTKWMKALAGGCAAVLMLPSMLASARTDDAVVFADFEGTARRRSGRSCPAMSRARRYGSTVRRTPP